MVSPAILHRTAAILFPKENLGIMPGFWELTLLLIICLLLFGARKLPEIGAGLGKTLANFQKGWREPRDQESRHDSSTPPRKS
jgi:sec-independent protein translocase protein TatA